MNKQIKGLILAAGFGKRLRPITDFFPKPLVPFFGKPILIHAIERLSHFAISKVAVNLCYKKERVEQVLEGVNDSELFLIREDPILGTGGVLFLVDGWLGDADLFVYNGDIVSDMDIAEIVEQHRKSKAEATMVVLPQNIKGTTPVFIKKQKSKNSETLLALSGFGNRATTKEQDETERGGVLSSHTLACAHVLSNEFVKNAVKKMSWSRLSGGYAVSLVDVYGWALARGDLVNIHIHRGFWKDLGTAEDYWSGHQTILKEAETKHTRFLKINKLFFKLNKKEWFLSGKTITRSGARIMNPCFVSNSAKLGKGANIGPFCVLNQGVSIEKGAKISNSVVFPGTSVLEEEILEGVILGDGFRRAIIQKR